MLNVVSFDQLVGSDDIALVNLKQSLTLGYLDFIRYSRCQVESILGDPGLRRMIFFDDYVMWCENKGSHHSPLGRGARKVGSTTCR